VALIDIRNQPTASDLKWFGVIVLAVFGIIGGVVLWRLDALRAAQILWSVGAVLCFLYYAIPPLRRPLYDAWMHTVQPIGIVISHVLLGFIYFGVITPIGLVMRLFGRDALQLRLDESASSYWTQHDPGGDTARYFRQT
jgi:hypothetical protein